MGVVRILGFAFAFAFADTDNPLPVLRQASDAEHLPNSPQK